MSLNNAHSVPMFYFSLGQMQKTTLPLAVDWCRNEKGADRYPFFVIRTDPLFCNMLNINKDMLPRNAEAVVTKIELSHICPGIYRVKKTPAEYQPLDQIEVIAEHLNNMEKQQHLGEDDEKMALELMTSRSYISKTRGFDYKEHLDFSVLDVIAQSRDDFPHGWNMENLPGKLTELLNGDNKILGVSTAMCYMGENGTNCVVHVENYDLASANVLLQHSAGKAWIGFNPDDERKLNAVIKKNAPETCCNSPLLHVDIMIDANLLDDLGITWYYVIQRPGDIVITNPRGFHQVHNLGYNFAEACNFVCDGYKKIARRRKACQCPGRLSLYQDFEPWKILSDYVYEGELEMLIATDATASLPVSELQKLYELVPPDEPWISAAAEEDEEDLGMLIDPATQISSNETQIRPMDLLNERIGSAIASAAVQEDNNQPMEESCDIFDSQPTVQPSTEESVIVLDTQTSTAKENATTDHDKESSDDEDELPPDETAESQPRRRQAHGRIDIVRNGLNNLLNATQRQKRADARADFLSQKRHWESHGNRNQKEESLRKRADEIRENKRNADTYRKSRGKSRESYEERNPGRKFRIRDAGPMSCWFKSRIQVCSRTIETAIPRIDEYKVTGKWYRRINYSERKEAAETKKSILEKRRLLYNALVKMYHHSPEVLQHRIAEKYFEKELIRDFIYYHNGAHRDLLCAALESLNADMDYWNDIFASEAQWNEEFGVDSEYRIPSVDWTTFSV